MRRLANKKGRTSHQAESRAVPGQGQAAWAAMLVWGTGQHQAWGME